MTEILLVVTDAPVPAGNIVAAISHHHRQAISHCDNAIKHSVMAGGLLLRQKAAVGHGGWLECLAENVEFTPRTAQRYMNAAAPRPKCDTLSHSTPNRKLTNAAKQRMEAIDRVQHRDDVMRHVAYVVAEMPPVMGLRQDDRALLLELRSRIDAALEAGA